MPLNIPESEISTKAASKLAMGTLMIMGQLVLIISLVLGIVGIIFLSSASSEKNEILKKSKKRKGMIFCVSGPLLFILIIITYLIIYLTSR